MLTHTSASGTKVDAHEGSETPSKSDPPLSLADLPRTTRLPTEDPRPIPRQSNSTDHFNDKSREPSQPVAEDENDDSQDILLRAFSPRVAVYASHDTEELIRLKGLYGGLCGLLRPFGEHVQGKVVIRDSIGASKSWNNFGVHFFEFQVKSRPAQPVKGVNLNTNDTVEANPRSGNQDLQQDNASNIDRVLRFHMHHDDPRVDFANSNPAQGNAHSDGNQAYLPNSYFPVYLRKLLSGRPMTPYEMFTHPVACVIAISSQNSAPIETLRDLYNDTRRESANVPSWASGEFLRYYVIVHDEDHDDFAKSMDLFNQMKRHFGLHCHLLRLRSVPCSSEDRDGSSLPECQWLSADEHVRDIDEKGNDPESADFQQYLFDSDATIIKGFIREMVTQSIVPFMEGRVASWNDQVASRRRGISGRFMSLSKRWTGFGSNRSAKAATNSGNPASNYDVVKGAYNADAPESVMHRLGDYALMLRDWKLSSSIYEILRTDFADDKAWYHHAVVNEMLAISLLLGSQPRAKFDTIDQMVDTATYSYITRCADLHGAIRCFVLVAELYRKIGGSGTGQAAKWIERLLELSLLSPLAQGIMLDRLILNHIPLSDPAAQTPAIGKRKAAFWSFLSSALWLKLKESNLSGQRLWAASLLYATSERGGMLPFNEMQEYWDDVRHCVALVTVDQSAISTLSEPHGNTEADIDEEKHDFVPSRSHGYQKRFSSVGKQPADLVDLMEKLNVPTETQDDGFA